MAFVRVEQRNARLAAGPVRIDMVEGREGQVAKGTVTAISNVHKEGQSPRARSRRSTAVQWTFWGKLAENAAEYLGKGSHVNIVGRLRQNNYDKDGETVYGWTFTVEEIDYLDSKAEGDARRAQQGEAPAAPAPSAAVKGNSRSRPGSKKAAGSASGQPDDDIPF